MSWRFAVACGLGIFAAARTAGAVALEGGFEPSNLGGEMKSATTSDGFFDQSIAVNWRNHRRDPVWPYETESTDGWDFGSAAELHSGTNAAEQYFGARASLTLARKLSPQLLTELELGVHQLTNRTEEESRAFPAGALGVYFNAGEETQLMFRAVSDLAYLELIEPVDLMNDLRFHRVQLGIAQHWQPWLRSQIHGERAWLSDGNARLSVDADTMVGLSTTGALWLWVGAGVENMGYASVRDGYWTPLNVVNVGPRVEAAWTIGRDWNASLGLNFNRVAEDALEIAPGMYASVAVSYGARERLQIKAESVTQRTWREGGGWASQAFRLGLATPL